MQLIELVLPAATCLATASPQTFWHWLTEVSWSGGSKTVHLIMFFCMSSSATFGMLAETEGKVSGAEAAGVEACGAGAAGAEICDNVGAFRMFSCLAFSSKSRLPAGAGVCGNDTEYCRRPPRARRQITGFLMVGSR
jgi:hypothetical protein